MTHRVVAEVHSASRIRDGAGSTTGSTAGQPDVGLPREQEAGDQHDRRQAVPHRPGAPDGSAGGTAGSRS